MINKASIWIICCTFAFAICITKNFIESIGYAATIYGIIWWLFDRLLWKVCPSQVKRCNISGKWAGTIHYNYMGKPGTKKASIVIKQTFSNIKIQVKTDENISKSIVAQWCFDDSKLFYIYQTDPHFRAKDKNPAQYGGAQIIINQENLSKVRIEYWTDRQTKG
jgi:hypothetical protein